MSGGFVDGEPEIRRMDDEVVPSGFDRLRLQLLDGLFGGLPGLRLPRVLLDVLVATRLRASQRPARLEVVGLPVYRGDGELRFATNQVLLDSRSFGRREEALFVDPAHRGIHEADAGCRERGSVEREQELDLVVQGDV